ncbi:MAG TPA: TetR family transcriptional regulator [Terriglobales bacterium]|nr:TetR family transcriptional regulator [Terriglobales bacterium]
MQQPDELPAPGLRERKKARTRAAIQRHALRLFREQGYDATTVNQIAEAAEVSESTFFRYFPSKEDVVLWDEFDPRVADVFRAQPPGASPMQAVRTAVREVLGQLGPEQQADLRERMDLMLAVPELRTNLLDQIASPMLLFSQMLAERTGRRPDDPAIRAFVGAVMGISIATMFTFAENRNADMAALLDEALGYLEAGLPL